jgi:hypothetical protein
MGGLQSILSKTNKIDNTNTIFSVVEDNPIGFEKKLVGVQNSRKVTYHLRGIYDIYPILIKKNLKMQ